MPNVMSIAKKIAADGIAAAIVTNAGMIHLPGSIPFSTDLSSGIEMTAAIDLSRYAMGEPVEFSLTSLADDILYNTLASYVSSYVMPDVRGMLGEYGIPDEAAKILGMGNALRRSGRSRSHGNIKFKLSSHGRTSSPSTHELLLALPLALPYY